MQYGLTAQEYKQYALDNLHKKVGQAFKLVNKTSLSEWTDNDTEKITKILASSNFLSHNTFLATETTLPSIFQFEDHDEWKIINYVMKYNNSVALKIMLDHGLDLYSCYDRQNSLLHEAVYRKADDCVQLILSYKKQGENFFEQERIDVQDAHDKLQLLHMPNIVGGTPLLCAAGIGLSTITQMLLTAGADVNQVNKKIDVTSLHQIGMNNSAPVAQLLLTAGANVHLTDCNGMTTLHFAARNNSAEVVPLFIDAGAHVNAIDKDGRTPLFYAHQKNANLVISLLIAAGGWVTEPTHQSTEVVNFTDISVAVSPQMTSQKNCIIS